MKKVIAKLLLAALIGTVAVPAQAGLTNILENKTKLAAGLALLACISFGYANQYKKQYNTSMKRTISDKSESEAHKTQRFVEAYKTRQFLGMSIVSLIGLLALFNK